MEHEQEISLREIIEALLNGKWIIVSITALFTIVAIIYSFIIADPVYESKATVIINKVEQPIGSLNEYVDNATSKEMVIDVMKSPEVIQKTIKDLNLDRTISSLQNSLSVTAVENNEALVRIKLQGTDRELISNILDQLIVNTRDSIKQSVDTYITSYQELYLEKMDEEQQQLNEFLQEYSELEKAVGLPLLVLFQQNAAGSEYILEANEALLQELRELDKETQIEYEQVNARINRANQQLQEFYNFYSDAVTAQSLELVPERVSVFSNAFASVNPVKPNKMLNTAIALVLGLMVSVGVVFMREYWRNSEEETKEV
ncbi:Wzz/FepE/Etk N-terminal domain-containing protein [Bacillaceae bacterium W0354]